jgi:Mn2+/Fe2+ NRAMP family transporter
MHPPSCQQAVLGGMVPVLRREHLYCAVSLLGANVMPHR